MRHVLPPAAFALLFLTALLALTLGLGARLHPHPLAVAERLVPEAAGPSPEPSPSPAQSPSPAAPSPTASAPATAAAPAPPAPARPAPPPPPPVTLDSYQQTLINQDRAGAGLAPLTWSGCLAKVASGNAQRMAAQGFASHSGGPTADLACGLGSNSAENVGYWTGGIDDAALNQMFMASPEHRANILGAFHYVATAWAVAPDGTGFLAVEFS